MRTALCATSIVLLAAACKGGGETPDAGLPDAGPHLELVGHSPLIGRGMNAALAVAGDTVYVGSRTDGVAPANAGILIVDVADPTAPNVVGQIGPPDEALIGMSSRELRAVADLDLLIVLNFACSTDIHACHRNPALVAAAGAAETDNFKFYDISDRRHPQLVATWDFGSTGYSFVRPHEFFVWRDPQNAARVLLYVSTPIGPPALEVLDISDLQNIQLVATWDSQTDGGLLEPRNGDTLLHSVSVSDDGRTAYVSHEGAGFFLVDTGEVADGVTGAQIRVLTPLAARVDYSPPNPAGAHSAVRIPGRDFVVLTDEIYPIPVQTGCPWGWARLIDIADPLAPVIVGEYKVAENDATLCAADHGPTDVTFTAHNTTATPSLALITWHSAGLQVVDTTDAAAPAYVTSYQPEPLATVLTEDPALGGHPVLMWSYPVIQDGLIYVIDIRNGLYVLRYHGPHEEEITGTAFAEGNSNL